MRHKIFVQLSITGVIKPVCRNVGQGVRRIYNLDGMYTLMGQDLHLQWVFAVFYNEINEWVIISCTRCSYNVIAWLPVADAGTLSNMEGSCEYIE